MSLGSNALDWRVMGRASLAGGSYWPGCFEITSLGSKTNHQKE